MVHEEHDAACSGQRFKVSKSGQYNFEMGIVRASTVLSFACKEAQTSHLRTWANSGKFSATPARWFVWYTNSMMQLVLARGLSGRNLGKYHFEMGIVRARTVQFNVKIASVACKGA